MTQLLRRLALLLFIAAAATVVPAQAQIDPDELEDLRRFAERYDARAAEIVETQREQGRTSNVLRQVQQFANLNDAQREQRRTQFTNAIENLRRQIETSERMIAHWRSLEPALAARNETVFGAACTEWTAAKEAEVAALQEQSASLRGQANELVRAGNREDANALIAQSTAIAQEAGQINNLLNQVKGVVGRPNLDGYLSFRWQVHQQLESLHRQATVQNPDQIALNEALLACVDLDTAGVAAEVQRLQEQTNVLNERMLDLRNRQNKAATNAEGVHTNGNWQQSRLFKRAFDELVLRTAGGTTSAGTVVAVTTAAGGGGNPAMIHGGVLYQPRLRMLATNETVPFFAREVDGITGRVVVGRNARSGLVVYCGRFVLEITSSAQYDHNQTVRPDWDGLAEAIALCFDTAKLAEL